MSPAPSRARRSAAQDCAAVLDSQFFKALCEPARIELVRLLIAEGRSDLGALAARVPQDASVVSRHLALLHAAGVVRRARQGRQVFFEVDGPAVVARLEEILARLRRAAPYCCPGGTS